MDFPDELDCSKDSELEQISRKNESQQSESTKANSKVKPKTKVNSKVKPKTKVNSKSKTKQSKSNEKKDNFNIDNENENEDVSELEKILRKNDYYNRWVFTNYVYKRRWVGSPETSCFCQRLYVRKCQRMGVGGQKAKNVVCQRSL